MPKIAEGFLILLFKRMTIYGFEIIIFHDTKIIFIS